MKKIFFLFICIAITIKSMAQGTSCSDAIHLFPYTSCGNISGSVYAGHYQTENGSGTNVTMTGTSTLNPACTSDNETTQSVEWLQVTATTTSFTITNLTDYTGGGAATAEKRDYVVYSGTCGALSQIACFSEVANGSSNTVTGLTAGLTYFIMVSQSAAAFSGYPTATGVSTCITSTVSYNPTNNVCSAPLLLTTDVTLSSTNTNSTADAFLCSGTVENNVWYEWCAPVGWPVGQSAFLNVNNQVCNSTQGLQLTIWNTGTACPTASSNPNVVCQNPGALTDYYYTWVPTPGTCYLIELDGFAGTACAYDITAGSINTTCTPPATPAASNDGPLCEGNTLNLTTPTVGGASYSWTGPNGFTSTSQNPTISNVTPAMAGTYSVTITVTPGCPSLPGTTTATINPNAAIALTSGAGTNAQTVCVNAAITNITYSITGGGTGASVSGLPAGVTGSYAAGVFTISGTPTATGTFNYTVTTTGTCTQTSATGSITVNPNAAIALTSAVGTNAQSLCINIAITNITYSVSGGGTGASVSGLPAGVTGSFAGGIFTITGTATASGTFNYTVTTTGTCAQTTATGTITVNPNAAIALTSGAGTNAQTICVNTAITNITYSVSGGGTGASVSGLPAGITGSYAAGVFTISGTPTATGTFNYTVTTTGTCTQTSATGSIIVNLNAAIALTSAVGTNAQSLCINTAITTITYSITGGGTGASVSGLPAGVTGSFAGGIFTITGTPTASGTFNYTVTTTGTCAQTTATGTLTINPNAAIALTSGAGTNAQTICVNTAITNITYSVSGGGTGASVSGLPAGVTGSYAAGVFTISGTPTATGTFNYTVTTTGTCTQTTATGSITVNPNAAIALTSAVGTTAQSLCINTAITNITYSVSGGGTGASVSGLPAGVTGSFAGGIFTITGTPTASGTFNYTVTTTGTCTQTTATGTITVNPLPVITSEPFTNETVCGAADGTITINATGTGLTYSINGGGSFVASNAFSGLAAGSYSVAVKNSDGCVINGSVISISSAGAPSMPTANASPNPLCADSTLTLSVASPVGGETYTWTGPGAYSAIGTSVTRTNVTTAMTGVYTVTATAGSCVSAGGSVTVTINPNAAIALTSAVGTNAQTLCLTSPITTITYSITGGGTGANVSGLPAGVTGSFAAGVFTISGTPTATGTFNYTVTTTGTCTQASAIGSIIVNPNAAITLTSAVGTDAQTLCLTSPVTTITYSITGGGTGAGVSGLPTGVTGSFAIGVFTISGTPTATGTFNYTVTTTGTCTQASATGSIIVNPNAAMALTSAVGTDAQTLCLTSPITTITYSITGGGTGAGISGLPAGVTGSFAAGVFTISGTPTATGTFNYTVTTTGTCTQASATGSIIINPNAAIALTSAVGTDAQTLCLTSPVTTITYSVTGGGTGANVSGLPAGVTGSFAAGVFTIGGTPTVTGTFNYTVTTTGTCTQASATGSIIVNPNAAIALTSAVGTDVQTLCLTSPITTITYAVTGGGTGASVSGLPTGTSGSFSGGVFTIFGTPTVTGTYNYTVTTTGTCSQTTAIGSITINPNASIALTSAAGTNAQTVCINTPITAITYFIVGGGTGAGVTGLPAGITGSFAAGVFTISGTPTASGTFNYTVTTTGTCAQATATGSITVNPDASITLTSAVGTDAQTVCINNGISSITYSVSGGGTSAGITGLPAGVTGTFAGGVFTIFGTPTATGTYNYTVTTTGTCAQTTATGNINVNSNAAIALTSAPGTDAQTLCVNNPILNITYSITGGGTGGTVAGLPAGITGSFAGGVFTISGAPTTTGTFNYTVTTTGACIQTTATGSVVVKPNAAINLTSAAGTAAQTLCLNTAMVPITYSITGSGTGAVVIGLPTGVTGSFSGGVFTINGTPSVSGTYNYTVTTIGTCAQTTASGNMIINSLPVIDTTNISITPASCGIADGSITGITASGTTTLSYTWNGVASPSIDITNIPIGAYTLAAKDLNGCVSSAVPFLIVNPGAPAAPTAASPAAYCQGYPIADLTATGSGGTLTWYSDPGLTNQVATGSSFVSGATTTSSFYVTETISGCESSATTVTITINPIPSAPTAVSPAPYCYGSSIADLTATGTGGTLTWFSDIGLTTQVGTGSSFASGATSTSIFYVTETVSGCQSFATAVTITVYPPPPVAINPAAYCQGDTIADLMATGTGGTLTWYSDSALTNQTGTGSPFASGATSTTTFYVTETTTGCTGSSTAVTITVNPIPSAPIAINPAPYCNGDPIDDLTATGTGGTLTWYSDAGLTNQVGTGSPFASGATATNTFYVTETVSGCQSLATAVTITVFPPPPVVANPATYCEGDSIADLTATGTGGILIWYSDPGLTNQVGTGSPFTSGVTTTTTTFYVTETESGCQSSATAVTITINPNANISLTSAIGTAMQTACINTAITPITYSVTGGGTGAVVTGLPSGITGSFAGGIYTISGTSTTTGTYNYSVITTGSCTQIITNGSITIDSLPGTPTAGNNGPVCTGSTLDLTCSGIAGATYNWVGPNGFTSSTQNPTVTDSVTLAMSGTYSVTAVVNGCSSLSGTTSVIVNPLPVNISAGTDTTIYAGSSATLIATGGGTYSWNTGETTSSIVVSPTGATDYCVIVTDANSCSNNDCIHIDIETPCGELFVAKAFSPNGDNQNDILHVKSNCIISNLEFVIFDRWGEKVFETNDSSIGWDGTFNGKRLDPATFVYYLKGTIKDETVNKHGYITLVK